ncbi:MAG: hypothetical protein U5N53_10010 [Mycobacterium sp.]|nr:hypothetical protein [Mycobacterium sp.]
MNAVTAGATDEFTRLGIEVVATTSAGFDSAKQLADVETTMAPETEYHSVAAFGSGGFSCSVQAKASEAGIKLVFLSNLPANYKHPTDYGAIVTDDLFQMGKQAADVLATSMGEARARSAGFSMMLPITSPTNATTPSRPRSRTTTPTCRLWPKPGSATRHAPKKSPMRCCCKTLILSGIYVTWAGPAEGVLAALRATSNTTTKIVTLDLSEPIALDMVKGGNVAGIVADEAYELGRAMAAVGARAVLGVENPPSSSPPRWPSPRTNVVEGWQKSLHKDAPQSVLDALK